MHYNWHRSYDPTLGRYTQPDPLGFVDGPSVYGYSGGSPQRYVDKDGRAIPQAIAVCWLNPACRTLILSLPPDALSWWLTPKTLRFYPTTFWNEEKADTNPPTSPINLDDPATLDGRTKQEGKDALDKDSRYRGPEPITKGQGEKYVREGTRGADQVILNDGYPGGLEGGGGDAIHQGPYAEITSKGKTIRVPLKP